MLTRGQPERSIKLKSHLVPVLVLILVGVQLFFPFKGWVIFLSGFGGMWLISYLWARSLKDSLRLDRELSFGWKQVGDRLQERVLLENEGWAPSLWVEIDDHSDMREYEISSVTDIRGGQRQRWITQGMCDHRGLFTIGPVTLEAEDPFGLYDVSVDYTDSVNMMVVPQVIPLPEIEIAPGGRIAEGRSSIESVRQTVSSGGVREYEAGDSLRWLHWPTTARMDDLYVRLFDIEPSSDWWVLLDMDPEVQVGEGRLSTEEHGVILAASIVNHGLQMGKSVGLVSYGEELVWHSPEFGDAHLWSILRSLATIRPGGPPLAQILGRIRSFIEERTSLVIITPSLDPEWISALELLKRVGVAPTVLLLDPLSFGGSGEIELFHRRMRSLGITHYTISADLLDDSRKRPKESMDWLLRLTRRKSTVVDKWQARWMKLKQFLRTWGLILVFYLAMGNILGNSVRGLESSLIWFVTGSGLMLGWLTARTALPGWAFGVLTGIVGVFLAGLRVGRFGNILLDSGNRLFHLIYPTIQWLFGSADPPDIQPLQMRIVEFLDGAGSLSVRVWDWISNLLVGQSYYDPVSLAFGWGIALWGTVVWSMWWIVRRKKPLLGFLPATALVVISLAFIGQSSYNLVFLLGATIALMVLIHHDARELRWRASQLNFTPTIRGNISIAAVILTIGLMVFSLITPSISIDRITDIFQQVAGERAIYPEVAQSLGLENQSEDQEIDTLDARREGGLPNQHLIGSGSELEDIVVMAVRIERLQSDVAEGDPISGETPLYFRSLAYDRYTGRGWASRSTEIQEYSPGEGVLTPQSGKDQLIRQQVQVVESGGGLVHTAGLPVSVDQDFEVAWRIQDEENEVYDIFGATVEADTYRADSMRRIHSVEELRSAGQSYPEWIRNRYISLPETVPEEVLTLSRDLTATEATPYDRAVAIERYLRKIPYTLDVTSPPAGADIAEYFLFSLQKGYCDYYATAMVVLARAAGLPARYVMGYIAEFYDEAEGIYLVTADQAHAWVEVYFPEYGWVPFEPTGGRPAIDRPPEPFPELPDDFELDFEPLVSRGGPSFDGWPRIVGLVLISGIGVAVVWWQVSEWRLKRMSSEFLLPKLYKRIYRYADWIGLSPRPGDTLYHFMNQFKERLDRLGRTSYWDEWLLEGYELISGITHAYVRTMFSLPKDQVFDTDEIIVAYKRLRPRLWLLWLLTRVYKYPILRPFFWRTTPILVSLPIEEDA